MNIHTIEGLMLGAVLITGFIISQILQARRRHNRRRER
jgi:hypothetical protein